MCSVTCNVCDIAFSHKTVVSLHVTESSTLVWGTLESTAEEQWYLIACIGSYLEGNRCGFPKSRRPRRYHAASQQEDDLFTRKVSLSRGRQRRLGRAGRAGQDLEEPWEWWMALPARRAAEPWPRSRESYSSSISKNKMQINTKMLVTACRRQG